MCGLGLRVYDNSIIYDLDQPNKETWQRNHHGTNSALMLFHIMYLLWLGCLLFTWFFYLYLVMPNYLIIQVQAEINLVWELECNKKRNYHLYEINLIPGEISSFPLCV